MSRVIRFLKPRAFDHHQLMVFDPSGGALRSYAEARPTATPLALRYPRTMGTGPAGAVQSPWRKELSSTIAVFLGGSTQAQSDDTGTADPDAPPDDSGGGKDWGGAGHGSDNDDGGDDTDTGTSIIDDDTCDSDSDD
jgi:hypothetical protein